MTNPSALQMTQPSGPQKQIARPRWSQPVRGQETIQSTLLTQ